MARGRRLSISRAAADQPLGLLQGKSRAKRGHGVIERRLVELDHTQMPLHEQHFLGASDGRTSAIQPKEQILIAEEGGVGVVEGFGPDSLLQEDPIQEVFPAETVLAG